MRRAAIAMAASIAVAGCASKAPTPASAPPAATPSTRMFDPAAPPAGWAPAIARADVAIADLQRQLAGRLAAALQEGGPAAAVTVCRDEAPRLTAAIGHERNVAIGRTSDRLRNPANAPPAWARAAVEASAGPPAAEVRPLAIDLGDRVGLLRPIVAGPACTRCHGPRESIAGDVAARVAREYPQDRAVGYAAGDHRGFFWVEAPR